MKTKWYRVCPDRVPPQYPFRHFPRQYRYKRDAVAAATELLRDPSGVTQHVRIEYSDGPELDLTAKTVA